MHLLQKKKKGGRALHCTGLEPMKPALQQIQELCLAWARHINSPPTAPSPQWAGDGGVREEVHSVQLLPRWLRGGMGKKECWQG